MTDQNGQSPADQPDPSEDRGNGASENGTPAAKPRHGGWRRLAKWLGGIVLVLVLCFALGVAMILYAVNSERGTRYVCQAATSLPGAHLAAPLHGGAIPTRFRLPHPTSQS